MNNLSVSTQDQKTYPVSNFYFDALMSKLSPSALSILLYVIEQTLGEGFDRAAISFSQFQKLCNLSCDSVTDGIRELEDLNAIEVIRQGPGRGKVSTFSLLCDPQARSTEIPFWYFKTFPELRFSMKLVLLAVIRKIIGWNKAQDRISFSQFQKLTGLSSRCIAKAVRGLEKSGLIYVYRPGFGKINTFSFVPFDYESTSVSVVPQKSKYPKNLITPNKSGVENSITPNKSGVEGLITPDKSYTSTIIRILLSIVFNSNMYLIQKIYSPFSNPFFPHFFCLVHSPLRGGGNPHHTSYEERERGKKKAENIFSLVSRAVDSSGVFIVKRARGAGLW